MTRGLTFDTIDVRGYANDAYFVDYRNSFEESRWELGHPKDYENRIDWEDISRDTTTSRPWNLHHALRRARYPLMVGS
ncbi:MAG: hypothetical protein E6Q97_12450 [Desulfurellales bacterium]|nr:MAG: hypothetical protein E6Q97_12450 [Desulfurellales bacterium]